MKNVSIGIECDKMGNSQQNDDISKSKCYIKTSRFQDKHCPYRPTSVGTRLLKNVLQPDTISGKLVHPKHLVYTRRQHD